MTVCVPRNLSETCRYFSDGFRVGALQMAALALSPVRTPLLFFEFAPGRNRLWLRRQRLRHDADLDAFRPTAIQARIAAAAEARAELCPGLVPAAGMKVAGHVLGAVDAYPSAAVAARLEVGL